MGFLYFIGPSLTGPLALGATRPTSQPPRPLQSTMNPWPVAMMSIGGFVYSFLQTSGSYYCHHLYTPNLPPQHSSEPPRCDVRPPNTSGSRGLLSPAIPRSTSCASPAESESTARGCRSDKNTSSCSYHAVAPPR